MATISEKIFSRASGHRAEAGEIVEAEVDYAMSHDGTSVLAIKAFTEMGSERVWDPERIVVPFDHIVPANNCTAADLQRMVRSREVSRHGPYVLRGAGGLASSGSP